MLILLLLYARAGPAGHDNGKPPALLIELISEPTRLLNGPLQLLPSSVPASYQYNNHTVSTAPTYSRGCEVKLISTITTLCLQPLLIPGDVK
ncbi:hypothetical protein PoB_007411100 [Plakobranchus ocellatus]|uniref:Secreted protein n=1 Tax=Plakobranchus ocellatus TaxID=259542 RepID=A0AAV4DUL7_9GAST|nr:hypothetical protein PoB_007411100 [Plakobranchus ocellatus]